MCVSVRERALKYRYPRSVGHQLLLSLTVMVEVGDRRTRGMAAAHVREHAGGNPDEIPSGDGHGWLCAA